MFTAEVPGTIRRDAPRSPTPQSLTPALLAVFGRFLVSFITVAAGLATIVSVAAFADGRAPEPRRVGQLVGGFAPAVAAVWVLLDLRRHGEDVALASLGARPLWVVMLLVGCAAPLFALDRPIESAGITASADRLHTPGLTIDWREGAAWRTDSALPFEGLPAPPAMSGTARVPLFHAGLRVLSLALGLLGLLRWRAPPGLIAGLTVAGLVFWAGT